MNLGKNYWASKKVSITGHTGFKGSWLLIWILKKGACFYSYLFRSNLKVKVNVFDTFSAERPGIRIKSLIAGAAVNVTVRDPDALLICIPAS